MNNFKRKSDKPLTREEELLLENEALRGELDYLKKLRALIQAEVKAKILNHFAQLFEAEFVTL